MRRRTFFGIVGAGAAGAAIAPMAGIVGHARAESTTTVRGRSVSSLDFLLAPLVGRPLPSGFRVSSVSEIDRGSAQITLTRQDGATLLVQAFRRSVQSSGLATTRLLDLRWMNGGDGDRVTHEAGGLAVMNLAARIRRIESASLRAGLSPSQRASLAALHTHERRTAIHGGFSVAEPETA